LNASPEVVFPYLSDMELFASVHPVISKMDSIGEGRYKVFETLKMGPLPFSFSYPATIEHDAVKGLVHMKAVIFKLTTVEMVFNLSAENGMTTIEETIQVKSKLPFNSFGVSGILKTQHLVLFKNIAEHICQHS
jgi:carbon monoxide dehydrogenase subunit G